MCVCEGDWEGLREGQIITHQKKLPSKPEFY